VGSGPKNARVGGTGYWQSREEIETLFTSGSGQKRTQGKSLWNLDGKKYFHRAETKWRQVYDSKKDMRVLYDGWESWITTMGSDLKIGDSSKEDIQHSYGNMV
jgi:hypothetical protein